MTALGAQRGRLDELDVVRVLTVVAVIGVHVFGNLVHEQRPETVVSTVLLSFTRLVFFALTAFVTVRSILSKSPGSWPRYWVKRLPLIVVPLIVWTAVYTWLERPKDPDVLWWLASTAVNVARGGGWYHLYFLGVTIQLYLLLPLLVRLVRRTRGHHGLVLVVAFLFQVALYGAYHLTEWAPGAVGGFIGRLVPLYAFAVVGGAIAADHVDELRAFVRRRRVPIFSITGLVALGTAATASVQLQLSGDYAWSVKAVQPVIVVWAAAVFFAMWAVGAAWNDSRVGAGRSAAVLRYLADRSFGVFLVHPLVIRALDFVADGIGASPGPWLVPVAVFVVLVVSLAITETITRLFPRVPLVGRVGGRRASRATDQSPSSYVGFGR